MKISQVIKQLRAAYDEHGDVEVMSDSADGAFPIEIGGVQEVVEDETDRRSKVLMLWGLESVEAEPLVLPPAEPQPDAPINVSALPNYWDERRRQQRKPDLSRCAAELRIALAKSADG